MNARSFADIAGAKLRTAAGKRDGRRKLIGIVHAASAKAGLTEEDRRAIYAETTGKTTLTDMDLAEIGRVLDRLNQGRARPMGHRPHVGKIRALWWTLYWLGETESPGEEALDAFVRRQTGLGALRFVGHCEAPAMIEGLKAWAARAGVVWPAAGADAEEQAERNAVIDAIWLKLVDRRAVIGTRPDAYVFAALELDKPARRDWSPRQLDDAIRLLGKRLRRAMAKPTT